MLIQDTVIEVQKVREGQGADLLGVDLTPDLTQGLEVWLVHIRGVGHSHPGLIQEINTVTTHVVGGHLHTLLIVVMMEDESEESSDPMGKIENTAVVLRRHLAGDTKEDISLQVKESTVKVDHL